MLRLTAPNDHIPTGITWSRQVYSGFAIHAVGETQWYDQEVHPVTKLFDA